MRFRFSIRDLLWLTALIAMGLGWWVEHWRSGRAHYQIIETGGQAIISDRYTGDAWEKEGHRWVVISGNWILDGDDLPKRAGGQPATF